MEPEITLRFSQQPFVPILRETGYVCVPKRFFFTNNSDIFLPSISELSLSLTISHQTMYIYIPLLPHTFHTHRPSCPSIELSKKIWCRVKSSRSLRNFFQSPVIAFVLGPNIFQDTVFWNTTGRFSPLSVRNQWKWIVKCIFTVAPCIS